MEIARDGDFFEILGLKLGCFCFCDKKGCKDCSST